MLHQVVDVLGITQHLGRVAQGHVRRDGVGQRPGPSVRLEGDAGGQPDGYLVEVGEAECLSYGLLDGTPVAGLAEGPGPAVGEQADGLGVARGSLDGAAAQASASSYRLA